MNVSRVRVGIFLPVFPMFLKVRMVQRVIHYLPPEPRAANANISLWTRLPDVRLTPLTSYLSLLLLPFSSPSTSRPSPLHLTSPPSLPSHHLCSLPYFFPSPSISNPPHIFHPSFSIILVPFHFIFLLHSHLIFPLSFHLLFVLLLLPCQLTFLLHPHFISFVPFY